MRVRVSHTLDDLERDQKAIVRRSGPDMLAVVRGNAKEGNRVAKADAKRTARRHGQHYPKAFTWEVKSAAFGAFVADYGPEVGRQQGSMAFEDGPGRQAKPHRNLARSLDVIGPAFRGDVRRLADKWFW